MASLSAKAALAVILASLPVLASCAMGEGVVEGLQAAEARSVADHTMNQKIAGVSVSGRDVVARAGDGAVARAGDVVARAGAGALARVGDLKARAKGSSKGSARKEVLEIGGERGTRFSGKCSIGGEERHVGGRVPERFSFEAGDKELECEIRKDGPGTLEVELAGGNDVRSMQRQTAMGNSVIRLTYSGNGASGVSLSQSQVSSTSDSSTKSR